MGYKTISRLLFFILSELLTLLTEAYTGDIFKWYKNENGRQSEVQEIGFPGRDSLETNSCMYKDVMA